jgi:uncharacterized lipoprotein YajG
MKQYQLILAAAALLILPSCVVGRRTIDPPVPVADHTAAKGSVVIASIRDLRVFENKPSIPSTPSIDGDHTTMSAADKNRMVGRQRNAYGMAMGDIGLPAGQTVQNKTRQLLAEAFARRGYTLAEGGGNSAGADIQEFWAWFTPGMWYVQFEAVIQCRLTVSKGGTSRTLTVKGHGSNGGQVASDANWNLAYERAFKDFLTNLDTELKRTGF